MENQPTQIPVPLAHLAPDAPISHLLSLRHNPRLTEMSPEQLRGFVQGLRVLATQAPTMNAKLLNESGEIKTRAPRKASAKTIKVNAALLED